jgi:hypothetical protein
MKDYSKYTIEELLEMEDKLHYEWDMELAMDGSGECGAMIAKHFQPHLEAINKALDEKGYDPSEGEMEYNDELPF